jgi:Aldehyde dehydrogenase family
MSSLAAPHRAIDIINPTTLAVREALPSGQAPALADGVSLCRRLRELTPSRTDSSHFAAHWRERLPRLQTLMAEDLGLPIKSTAHLRELGTALKPVSLTWPTPLRVHPARLPVVMVSIGLDPGLRELAALLPHWLEGRCGLLLWPMHINATRLVSELVSLLHTIKPATVGAWLDTAAGSLLTQARLEGVSELCAFDALWPAMSAYSPVSLAALPWRLARFSQEWVVIEPHVTPAMVVPWLVQRRLGGAGQLGAGAQVIFVQPAQSAAWVDALQLALAECVFGDPLDGATDVGPLIDKKTIRRVEDQVPRAILKRQGRLVLGGRQFRPSGLTGYFFQPTLLTEVQAHSPLVNEPIGGPIMVLNTHTQLPQWLAAQQHLTTLMCVEVTTDAGGGSVLTEAAVASNTAAVLTRERWLVP